MTPRPYRYWSAERLDHYIAGYERVQRSGGLSRQGAAQLQALRDEKVRREIDRARSRHPSARDGRHA